MVHFVVLNADSVQGVADTPYELPFYVFSENGPLKNQWGLLPGKYA